MLKSAPILLCCLFYILFLVNTFADEEPKNPFSHLQCRDPVFGGGHHDITSRKFLVLSGLGGGIGNYLSFYSAAFYFAALTGRVRNTMTEIFFCVFLLTFLLGHPCFR
jgi:hypothetical protein